MPLSAALHQCRSTPEGCWPPALLLPEQRQLPHCSSFYFQNMEANTPGKGCAWATLEPLFVRGCLGHCSIFCPVLSMLAEIGATCISLAWHAQHPWGVLSLFIPAGLQLFPLTALFPLLLLPFCPAAGRFPGWLWCLGCAHPGSAYPTACAPLPSPGDAQARGWMQAACKCCLVYESCLVLVQTAVWGELGKFVWQQAPKLTKGCRAGAAVMEHGVLRGQGQSPASAHLEL